MAALIALCVVFSGYTMQTMVQQGRAAAKGDVYRYADQSV